MKQSNFWFAFKCFEFSCHRVRGKQELQVVNQMICWINSRFGNIWDGIALFRESMTTELVYGKKHGISLLMRFFFITCFNIMIAKTIPWIINLINHTLKKLTALTIPWIINPVLGNLYRCKTYVLFMDLPPGLFVYYIINIIMPLVIFHFKRVIRYISLIPWESP